MLVPSFTRRVVDPVHTASLRHYNYTSTRSWRHFRVIEVPYLAGEPARSGDDQGMVTMTMAKPNTRLRAVRLSMHLSQAEMARAIRQAGDRSGEPNACSTRNVQRWEEGAVPRGAYVRALERATGQPAENLGIRADERYGIDTQALAMPDEPWPEAEPWSAAAPMNGIWLSRYTYHSSGRGADFTSAHYVLVI